jgi:hypothetical protein
MNYTIALVGDRAAGKTAFMHLIKDIPLPTITNNRYHPTIGSEVHPIDYRGYVFNIYDMGKFSSFNNMPQIDFTIFVTKKINPELPVIPGGPPMVVVNNRDYCMTRTDAYDALDKIVEIV